MLNQQNARDISTICFETKVVCSKRASSASKREKSGLYESIATDRSQGEQAPCLMITSDQFVRRELANVDSDLDC